MSRSEIPVVEVSGAPRERGRQYGEAARDLIATAIGYYSAALGAQTGLGWGAISRSVRTWLPISEELAPHLVEEMRGIAEGAGVGFDEILALNLRGEFVHNHRAQRAGQPKAADAATIDEDDRGSVDGCTSFFLTGAASGTGDTLVGQNWDWRTLTAETTMAIRVVQDPLPTVVMQVEAGQVGRHGANSSGIALNANGLGGTFDSTIGLPQTLIRRLVLDSADIASALKVLVKTRPHIASNALLAHRSGFGIDLETTPHGVDWVYPDESGMIAHTNHYQAAVPPQLAGRYRPASSDSLLRLPRVSAGLRRVASATSAAESREAVRAAMSDHLGFPEGVCTHPVEGADPLKQWSTLLSSCVNLSTGQYHVAAGYPCETPYTELPWNLYDGPGSPS
ncbi:acyl-coenzyme A--6-aminopenicillanic-acid-acyltransferase form [Leucobacter sp. OLJS4]|uniref:C45 family autoproteolytic acyltransferase/hydolase n=1 Tax=unclassified Leucobacter TaxID=2621730 RepID=UPI000C19BA3A|nr:MULTISPECIES: C45 family peptidase [unclassified Leucobacter]PII88204.1 acyl-coenzyme A--6-aminopenicillanic-acid-acyltransferase form [Leucobacter sp. OLCALW19]PII88488.1 acyl-coenzyme A--6-aminopenicillanic-acid-acyltransferase form [Leucobacter sp. OLTLW20]PII94206.1 acyl-coenzyme A--6-aminopenicillanic-acid-acyltransferase form [Leucobacter sp. OLAS13]PII98222.1 acyl-coenzyme A--6-aminopenicillanic-acid-acyltransferase form [Leucobacter sp. OLDS2]PII98365.1 acyl-coenzyme A--6-aminopenic